MLLDRITPAVQAMPRAYSYTFLCSIVVLSVFRHICALCLNRSTDLNAICLVHIVSDGYLIFLQIFCQWCWV